MEFFSSLPKREQKVFSELTMAYAGPSKKDLHIGCLAAALERNANQNDDDEDEYDVETQVPQHFVIDGTSYMVRCTEIEIGTLEVDNTDGVSTHVRRMVIDIQVKLTGGTGWTTWAGVPATHINIEHTQADVKRAYWQAAAALLPKLGAMIKCVSCGMDILDRIPIVQPDGQTFLSNHCGTCTTKIWSEPCTECGSYIGKRGYKATGNPGAYVPTCTGICKKCEEPGSTRRKWERWECTMTACNFDANV